MATNNTESNRTNFDYQNGDIILEHGDGSKTIYYEEKLEREQRELSETLYRKIALFPKSRADIKPTIENYLQGLQMYQLALVAHYMLSYSEPINQNKIAYMTLEWILARLQKHLKFNNPYRKPTNRSKINWEKAREQIKCVDVAERFGIRLIKQGQYYAGLCPYHQEKTPSFKINPIKNTFTCYGCGKWGNSIDLLNHLNK